MSDTIRSDRAIADRDNLNDVDEILSVRGPALDEVLRLVPPGGDCRFTWDYQQSRAPLKKLYEKAKRSQWNASTDIDWSLDVDLEKLSWGLLEAQPELSLYRQKSKTDRSSPTYGWTDDQFVELALQYQVAFLSNITHGEQGALLCTAKICEQAPWIDAKYYAATQVMDEARHVEVFSRYLHEKLKLEHPINGHLLSLLEDILSDDRWDVTYLGMQIMVEGLALAAFGFAHATTTDPLLKTIMRYVMSDEARHVAFGVLSLKEAYDDMTAAEIRERQEFAFESGLRLRDRMFVQDMWERVGVDPRAQLNWQMANFDTAVYGSILFAKIVPNVKKLGLLDAGDGWLRQRYTDIGVIQYEDWIDTAAEYESFDAVDS